MKEKKREREKGEKKGRKRKGKEGKREHADSVGGCVGRFLENTLQTSKELVQAWRTHCRQARSLFRTL